MKKLMLILGLGLLSLPFLRAERTEAIHWQARLSPAAPVAGDIVELVVSADLAPHAVVYSSDFKSDIGPQPTALDLTGSEGIEVVGDARSVEPKRKKDKTWDIELGYFETHAEVRQQVRILRADFVVRGTIAGQLCDEKEGTCTLFNQRIVAVPAGK
jgi:thiol:disulfide interchange protein DsbD